MEDLKIIRKEINANTTEHFEFDINGFEYLVKNFSESDIYVAFKETNDTDEMIKIPAECDRICLINKSTALDNSSKDVYVFTEDGGEVEVQCVKY